MEEEIQILYKNWRGEIATRRILPKEIYFGETKWHPEKQWLLIAEDLDKKEIRHFALQDILSWSPEKIIS